MGLCFLFLCVYMYYISTLVLAFLSLSPSPIFFPLLSSSLSLPSSPSTVSGIDREGAKSEGWLDGEAAIGLTSNLWQSNVNSQARMGDILGGRSGRIEIWDRPNWDKRCKIVDPCESTGSS